MGFCRAGPQSLTIMPMGSLHLRAGLCAALLVLGVVACDKSAEAQLGYMQKYRMPFFATVWDRSRSGSLKQALCGGKGIPSLTLVDSGGEILARSYVDGAYQGCDGVLDAAKRLVPAQR